MLYKIYSIDGILLGVAPTVMSTYTKWPFTGIIEGSHGKTWYENDNIHRHDGPAMEYTNGTKLWYINSKLHRLDGPAIEVHDGSKEWWIDNKQVTELQCKLLCDIMKLKGLV
jgi:hypothetical protein